MPSPGAPAAPRLPSEDSYLELLADTLEGLDVSARGPFLQRYFRTTASLDLSERESLKLWDEVLLRRRELGEALGRQVSMKAVLMDVLASTGVLQVPVVMEYGEYKRLRLNAVTDPLTGLYNRRLFAESFEKELNRARRYGLPLGIAILDLHRFKEVNDKYGHPSGDDVLRAAALTLRKALRTSDSAFRIGGDEFALILPQTDAAQALALSRRIETVFAETLLPLHLGISVTMDHGIANFPQDGDQSDQLIRVADDRLYRLKQSNHSRTGNGNRTPVQNAASAPPAPEPIAIDANRPPTKADMSFPAASVNAAQALSSQTQLAPERPLYTVQRKAERVTMAGTNAYAVIGEQGTQRARVLDLGFGGVALEFDGDQTLPDNILAILHVPILPPVRVYLKPVWSRRTESGTSRFGCHFLS